MNASGSEFFFPTREIRTQTFTSAPWLAERLLHILEQHSPIEGMNILYLHYPPVIIEHLKSGLWNWGSEYVCDLLWVNLHLHLNSHVWQRRGGFHVGQHSSRGRSFISLESRGQAHSWHPWHSGQRNKRRPHAIHLHTFRFQIKTNTLLNKISSIFPSQYICLNIDKTENRVKKSKK